MNATSLPSLHDGDHLDQSTFHARYKASPEDFRVELIGGVVYLRDQRTISHGRSQAKLVSWLCFYDEATPDTEGLSSVTNILGPHSEPEPDGSLFLLPEFGGQTWTDIDDYLNGAPEWIGEICETADAIDLHAKKFDYEAAGPFLLSMAVGKAMLARGKGNQINITSLNNDRPLKGVMPYAVSKAGLEQMTRSLAMAWGPRGIRVNAIAPGFVLTDLTKKLWSQPKMQEWGKTNTPLVRLGQSEDMVGATVFLASEASAWMTGQTPYVDGGFSAGLVWPIDFGDQ